MKKEHNILVTTDLSIDSTKTVFYAAQLASVHQSELTIITKERDNNCSENDGSPDLEDVLKSLSEQVIDKFNIKVNYKVLQNASEEAIAAICCEKSVELIIVNPNESDGIVEKMLNITGSCNKEKSILNTKLLTIPSSIKALDEDFHRVMYIVEMQDEDVENIREIIATEYLNGDSIYIAHVNLSHSGTDSYNFNLFKNKLKKEFPEANLRFIEKLSDSKIMAIQELIHNYDINIVVSKFRDRQLIIKLFDKSFIRNSACDADVPLMALPNEY